MRIAIRPSLLIVASLILGYIGLFLDGTVIKYEIIHDINSANSSEISQQEERLIDVYQDHYWWALSEPCRIFRKEEPSPFFQFVFFALQWFGRVMNIVPSTFGLQYAVQRKVKLWKFFVVLVLLAGIPLLMMYLFPSLPTNYPDCDDADIYLARIVSIYPYWPKLLLSLFSILFGYLSLSSINKAKLQGVEPL